VGKVRTETIKRIARDLLERHPGKFTVDYEANKQIVDQVVDFRSKRMRNRISGYVTRLKKVEDRGKAAVAPSSEESSIEEVEAS